MTARDELVFSAERCGDRLAILVRGYDMQGSEVVFEVDPATLTGNLRAQLEWAMTVQVAGTVLTGFINSGVDVNSAWTYVLALLPPAMLSNTSWRPAEVAAAQRGDQAFEIADDLGRKPGDGNGRSNGHGGGTPLIA